MSVAYNPRIVVDGILQAFDCNNPKSFANNGYLYSMVYPTTINTWAAFDGVGLVPSGVKSSPGVADNLNDSNTLSVVVLLSVSGTPTGTLFSLYGNTNQFYINTDITSSANANGVMQATSNLSANVVYANSSIISKANANGVFEATTNSNIYFVYANSSITSSANANGVVEATTNVNIYFTYASSDVTESANATGNLVSLSEEIYFDNPDSSLMVYFESGEMTTSIKEGANTFIYTNNYSDFSTTDYDILTFTFKKSSNTYTASYWQNFDQLSQSSNNSNIKSFSGTNLSLFNRNGQGNPLSNVTVKTVLIYSREMSESDLRIISTGTKKS